MWEWRGRRLLRLTRGAIDDEELHRGALRLVEANPCREAPLEALHASCATGDAVKSERARDAAIRLPFRS
jgi:hypothetical protein